MAENRVKRTDPGAGSEREDSRWACCVNEPAQFELGSNICILKSSDPNVPLCRINPGILWFFIADLSHLAPVLVFPEFALFLPPLP